jgi:ribose transport system ATP-binding protein
MTSATTHTTTNDQRSAALRLDQITKTFPGVRALDAVSLHVDFGEVHGLIGENGAGKSTLMAIAAGSLRADSGELRLAGSAIEAPSPALVRDLGVAIVYQHPALAPQLSLYDNFILGVPQRVLHGVADTARWVREKLRVMGVGVPLDRLVAELTVSERQLIEIAKALATDPEVLILDEPTAALTVQDTELLFQRIRELTDAGKAVVYISHRLRDIERLCDRVTVLRDGCTRGTFRAGHLDEDEILRLIVGRSVDRAFPPKATAAASLAGVGVAISDLEGERFGPITMGFDRGLITGLAGIDGNGQTELLRALHGLEPASGRIAVNGADVPTGSPVASTRHGIVYIPADRSREGIFGAASVRFNITLTTLTSHVAGPVLMRSSENRSTISEIRRLAIKTPSPNTAVGSLSGGNQQKITIARALQSKPSVILAEEPTQGVDAAARLEIYRELRDAANRGATVIVLSTDAVELEHLCDRVVVMSRGQAIADLRGSDVTEDQLTRAAVTSTTVREHSASDEDRSARPRFARRRFERFYGRLALTGAIVALGAYTAAHNSAYLDSRNIESFLFALSILGLVAIGQFAVVMLGGVDLSVGPLASLVTVVSSFVLADGGLPTVLAVSLALGIGLGVGLVNGMLVRLGNLSPVIATLVTFFSLQGLALLLRPNAGGGVRADFTDALETSWGPVPLVFIALVVVVALVDIVLAISRAGIGFRAVGSSEHVAVRVGVRPTAVHLIAYLIVGAVTGVAGLVLAAQIGVGDAGAGTEFTLSSIAAVVIGGTSLAGGRGSAFGVFLGATLLIQIQNVSAFLQLSPAWQYWLLGILTLGSAAALSRRRDAS